ncbi:hypothetical protein BU26DRAFT_304668 [Trematosphaeria pertusa]|uniref:Uncharacterized protein n=1 Tax=Trematosphaeria pertusa TaxID=390896 RepID=A0A6A6IEU4_9PLEO|nr:uncharacterized protein BU26DRAFT_304668 [Trematosphaeria pertusa]KAF2248709.1 hypothetical protein BU26DRAFT_304668 [Trematosphaeria pertusa]
MRRRGWRRESRTGEAKVALLFRPSGAIPLPASEGPCSCCCSDWASAAPADFTPRLFPKPPTFRYHSHLLSSSQPCLEREWSAPGGLGARVLSQSLISSLHVRRALGRYFFPSPHISSLASSITYQPSSAPNILLLRTPLCQSVSRIDFSYCVIHRGD